MMLNRRWPIAHSSIVSIPRSSGPRCATTSSIRERRARTAGSAETTPAMPHMAGPNGSGAGRDGSSRRSQVTLLLVPDRRAPVAHAGLLHEQERIDQVVDVERMVERAAVAEHRERAGLRALEDHEEALGIAGPVDRRRAQDHRGQAALVVLEHEGLGLVLGAL